MDEETKRLIAAVKDILQAYGYYVDHLWHVNDVHFICEQQGLPPLSDEEVMQVFKLASQQFDGETGMSWPQLEKALGLYLKRKKALADLHESVCE